MRITVVKGLGQSTAQVQGMIQSAAAGYSVPGLATVSMAVANHESRFQPGAQNPGSSAAGVFQLVSSVQTTMGVTNPYDAQQNVNAGVALLAGYYQQYGNWNQALQAFSDGPGTVAKGMPPSRQTLDLIGYVNANGGGDMVGNALAASANSTGTGTDTSSVASPSGLDLSWVVGDQPGTDTVGWPTVALVVGGAVLLGAAMTG